MASSSNSNRHWPSMFKSKPCTSHHNQWQHDSLNSSSTPSCHRTPHPPEERSCGEPKPRWNPRPEQIRILEAIFNSGTTNPSRDEIRKIRAQLQQYGQVGDANVFYWFQNRKSRSKHKLRHQTAPPSNPSNNKRLVSDIAFSDSPSTLRPPQPFFFPGVADAVPVTQGFCFSEPSDLVQPPHDHQLQHNVGPSSTSLLLTEIMNHGSSDKDQQQQLPTIVHNPVPPTTAPAVTVPSPLSQIQGVGETGPAGPAGGTARCTVFINDVAFEVGVGPFSVWEAFGDDVALIDGSGQPVVTDEWGVTLQSLQHGAFYYLVRTLTSSYFPSHQVQ